MDKFKIKIIPKCTGSIPKDFAIGTRMGVNKINAAVPSTNIPRISRKIFIISKSTIGLFDISVINLQVLQGSFPK